MSENILKTHVGSEIDVTVYFDYQPEEPMERDYPGCPSEVALNAVYVNGLEDADILETLNDSWVDTLKERCEQMIIDNARDEYERSQE